MLSFLLKLNHYKLHVYLHWFELSMRHKQIKHKNELSTNEEYASILLFETPLVKHPTIGMLDS